MFILRSIICILIIYVSYNIRTVEGGCDIANSLGISPTVQLSTGAVQGLSCVSALDLPYFSFRSIPYAAPPLGDLRFKAPQPPPSWEGVHKADVESPACLQPFRNVSFPITYSEDCLFVNVYTPYLRHPSGKLMPVLVWVHGGKFYQGSGSSYKYGPDFLIEKDVIMVSFNYRLGVFGYLDMNTPGAPGNAAMKDSVAALKWIQREISNFGGDPNLVAIFGGSSGGAAVTLLYLSPMAKGLFSSAMSHSGRLSFTDFYPSNVDLGLQLASAFGCPSLTPEDAVVCLQEVDGPELAEKQMMFKGLNDKDNPFQPTLETDLGEEMFFPEDPQILLTKAPPVPFIMGVNSGEGLMYVNDPADDPDQFTNITFKLEKEIPDPILESASPPALQEVVSQVREFYFVNSSSLRDEVIEYVDFMSDAHFIHSILWTAKTVTVRAPLYLYYFTFKGEFEAKSQDYYKLNLSLPGVCHGEELGYIFYRNYTVAAHNNLFAYPKEMDMVDAMTGLWANFAAYGAPTPHQPKLPNSTWLPMDGGFTQYLHMGDDVGMVRSPLLQWRMAFWDNMFSFALSEPPSITNLVITGISLILLAVIIFAIVCVKKHFRQKGYINCD